MQGDSADLICGEVNPQMKEWTLFDYLSTAQGKLRRYTQRGVSDKEGTNNLVCLEAGGGKKCFQEVWRGKKQTLDFSDEVW